MHVQINISGACYITDFWNVLQTVQECRTCTDQLLIKDNGHSLNTSGKIIMFEIPGIKLKAQVCDDCQQLTLSAIIMHKSLL